MVGVYVLHALGRLPGCPKKISNYQRAYATQHARHTTQTNESNCRRRSGSAHSTSVLFDLGNVLGTGGDPLLAFFALYGAQLYFMGRERHCETVIGIVSEPAPGSWAKNGRFAASSNGQNVNGRLA
jgi:hypothetical protein